MKIKEGNGIEDQATNYVLLYIVSITMRCKLLVILRYNLFINIQDYNVLTLIIFKAQV